MKTANRIHRNRNTNPPPSQRKTFITRQDTKEWNRRIDAEFAPPKDRKSLGSCLAIYDCIGKRLVSRIPLSEKDFRDAFLLNAENEPGFDRFERFIADAIHEKLHRNGAAKSEPAQPEIIPPYKPDPRLDEWLELENAKDQAIVLSDLLFNIHDHQILGDQWTQEHASRMSGGIYQLVNQTNGRLERAYSVLWESRFQGRDL